MTNLDTLTDEIHRLMLAKNDAKDIKLLNVSLGAQDEHHWRFRTPDGRILQISLWEEDPPGNMRIATPLDPLPR